MHLSDPASSSTIPPSVSPVVTTTSFKSHLITLLGIPASLTRTGDVTIQLAYQKYKGFLTAFQTYEEMMKAKTWTSTRPTKTDIIELFVSKSFFHSHYKRYFLKVAEHDDMVAWLDDDEDRMNDLDLWGLKKETYTFTDLAAW